MLEQASKCCLRSVHIEYPIDEWSVCEYPMNPYLGKFRVVLTTATKKCMNSCRFFYLRNLVQNKFGSTSTL